MKKVDKLKENKDKIESKKAKPRSTKILTENAKRLRREQDIDAALREGRRI
jgi:hypothetical protein